MSQKKKDENVLYQDEYCKVTKEWVEIAWFYFPTAQKRKIKTENIKKVYFDHQGLDILTAKGWGMSFSPIWWACDIGRQFRGAENGKRNVVLDAGETTDKGFSVVDIDAFLSALKPLLNSGTPILDQI